MTHFIRFIFLNLESARRHLETGFVYEGTYQMVAAELKVAKYCWDEVFTLREESGGSLVANGPERELRKHIASMMHAAYILIEAEHMIEQQYEMSSTEATFRNTLEDLKADFLKVNSLLEEVLESRAIYREEESIRYYVRSLLDGHILHDV